MISELNLKEKVFGLYRPYVFSCASSTKLHDTLYTLYKMIKADSKNTFR